MVCVSLWLCVPASVCKGCKCVCVCAAAEKQNRLMQSFGRSGWVWPPVCNRNNRPLRLRCMRAGIGRPFLNCVADSRHPFMRTETRTPRPAQRAFSKRFPPLDKLSGIRVICPCRCLKPCPSLVSSGAGTLPGRRYHTVSLHTGLDSGRGRAQASGAAPAVRCCKWLLELTDRSPTVPRCPPAAHFISCVARLSGWQRIFLPFIKNA